MLSQQATSPRVKLLTFFAGFEAFHALVHAYLSLSSETELKGHPAERLGFKVDRKFHAIAALANAGLAIGLGVMARKSMTASKFDLDRRAPSRDEASDRQAISAH